MKKSILLCLLLCACSTFAQTFDDYTRKWATYFGGQGTYFTTSVVDSQGNIITAGYIGCYDCLGISRDENYYNQFSTRPDLPFDTVSSTHIYQTLIAKFSPDGALLASGYLPFYAYQMEIDNADNLYILGDTRNNSIGTPNVWLPTPMPEIISNKQIIIKLNSGFETLWCSYIPSQSLGVFCLDDAYNIYGIGATSIDHTITTPNTFQPDFIAEYDASNSPYVNGLIYKLNSNGQLQWSSYYGVGLTGLSIAYANDELITSFAKNGAIELLPYESDYYTPGAYQQSPCSQIISKFNASTGQRIYSTYLGDSELYITSIVAGENGYYFLGTTVNILDADLISSNAFQPNYADGAADLYLGKFSTSVNPIWGTYIGGSDFEESTLSQMKYKSGALYLTTFTMSADDFIHSPNPYQSYNAGVIDVFFMKFSVNGDFIWGSFFGGEATEYSNSITPANDSVFYLVGSTYSLQNIATPGSWQESMSFHPSFPDIERGNGFIAKFAPEVLSSVAEVEDKPFLLYPNPVFDNELTIAGAVKEGYVLKIYSLLGQNLFQTNLTASLKQTIEIPTLSSGTYILSIFDNNRQLYTSKITKQ